MSKFLAAQVGSKVIKISLLEVHNGTPCPSQCKKWAKFPSTNDFHTKFICEQQYLDVYPLFDFCSSRQIPFISVANMTRCTREEGGARYLTTNVLKPPTTCGSRGYKKRCSATTENSRMWLRRITHLC